MSDILERAKALQNSAFGTHGQALDMVEELISEVEASRDKIAQDAITIKMHHENVLTLQKEVERLRSSLRNLTGHNYVNAMPDGGYALRILQSYREACDLCISDNTTGRPTNPLYIALNDANEKRKIELDKAISDLAEVERLRSVAEARLQLNWTLSGECNELKQEIATKNARIKELEAENHQLIGFCKDYLAANANRLKDLISRDEYIERLEAAFLSAAEDAGLTPRHAREALERIKAGGKDESE